MLVYMGLLRKKFTIIVACRANITRSPYLCGYMKKYLKKNFRSTRKNVRIISAGVRAAYGGVASEVIQHIAKMGGFSLRGHRSYPVDRRVIALADVILVMEQNQKTELVKRFPEAAQKTFLLTAYLRENYFNKVRDIIDPTGLGAPDYQEFIAESHAEVARIFKALHQKGVI